MVKGLTILNNNLLKGFLLITVAILLINFISCSSPKPPEQNKNEFINSGSTLPVSNPADAYILAEQEKQFIKEFALQYASIERDWDNFHNSYNTWFQSRGIPMEPDMEEILSQLVKRFQIVKTSISGLATLPIGESITGKLYDSAANEEQALRSLRDNWRQSGRAAFKEYENNIAQIEKERMNIKRTYGEMTAAGEPLNKESLDAFYSAYTDIEVEWDKLGQDYNNWRNTATGGKSDLKELSDFLFRMQGIAGKIYNMPRPGTGQDIYSAFIKAAEREEQALGDLKRNREFDGKDASNSYEAERQLIKKMRNQVALDLDELRKAGLDVNNASLSKYSVRYQDIEQQWDAFHSDYHALRNPASNADRDTISRELLELEKKCDSIIYKTQYLPQSSLLRPLIESLISAAETEQGELRRLQNSWRPYESTAWNNYYQGQRSAEKNRREIRSAFNDLLMKYNLSSKDLMK